MNRFVLRLTIGVLVLFHVTISSLEAKTVSRAEALSKIVRALSLPLVQGTRISDVPSNHAHVQAIESAFAMGILFPSDRFYPDIAISRAEALAFAFKAIGWGHESDLLRTLDPTESDLPPYLVPFVTLAKESWPSLPKTFTAAPGKNLTKQDLDDLASWLGKCMSSGIRWERRIDQSGLTLLLHREGVGRPSKGWAVTVTETVMKNEAEILAQRFRSQGQPCYLERDSCTISVRLGPYNSYVEAWLAVRTLPSKYRSSSIVPVGGGSNALFWAAVVAPASKASIVTAPAIGALTLPLSVIAEQSAALAAVNAGFFWKGRPVGALVVNGTPVSAPYKDRSAIGWNQEGEVSFGSGNYVLKAKTPYGEVLVPSINSSVKEGFLGFFTPHFGQFATKIKGQGTEILLEKGHVLASRQSVRSNHFMEPNQNLLFLKTKALGPFASAKSVDMKIEWKDPNMKEADQVIQAGPLLLGSSRGLSGEWFSQSLLEKRHPRTLVGWDTKHLWWLVIDGRSSWHSLGLTLPEAGYLMRQLGLSDALNLDGGGSSQLWWNGITVNSPSEGRERPLPYAVVFR
ncbi:MAG: hypothetical protein CSA35_05140 [Dethiosulfovibrio peptidovorans]|nr:MAG: hypothetical protein CSA35_05140 [Dethiosulfovibrio peptidovorans]